MSGSGHTFSMSFSVSGLHYSLLESRLSGFSERRNDQYALQLVLGARHSGFAAIYSRPELRERQKHTPL
tara:strand:- start:26 stop:232 length:207 start_codon:yes stop_codon:yes gene_type:complete